MNSHFVVSIFTVCKITTIFICLCGRAYAGGGVGEGSFTSSNDASLSAGQRSVFTAMQGLCGTPGFTGSSLACELTSGSSASNGAQLQNLSPQAAMQAETTSITSPQKFIRSVNKKAQQLLDRDSGESVENDAYSFIGPFGISISGGGGFGDRDTANGQTGFKVDTQQANFMIDYSFNSQWTGGFSFGYLNSERDLGLNSGSLDSDSYRFAPFLLFRPTTNSYLTAMAGYALVNYESNRLFSPFTDASSNVTRVTSATAEYDADQYFASIGGGYTFAFKDGWKLHGYGRADYSQTDIQGFQENGGIGDVAEGGNSYAMQVDGQSINSITTTIGAELSYAISTSTIAAVIIPKIKAEWVHEYKNSGESTTASFNRNTASQSLGAIAIAGPERNWANLGFGLQMLFPHAIVGYINYDALIIDNASNHSIIGGIRISF